MKTELRLPGPDDTVALGRLLGQVLADYLPLPALMLEGGLGAGKTTFVRGLVDGLENSEQAEVASPSFNIYNLYPTCPQVAHFDLYRLEGAQPDDEFFEFLSDPETLVVVEWAEYLAKADWPEQMLHIAWSDEREGRLVTVKAIGEQAVKALNALLPKTEQFRK